MTGHGGLYYGLVENFLSSVGRELRAFVSGCLVICHVEICGGVADVAKCYWKMVLIVVIVEEMNDEGMGNVLGLK